MRYLCDPQVIPAVVPYEFSDVAARAEQFSSFAQWLHVDITDGHFTPDKNWPLAGMTVLPSGLQYEAHLMTAEPQKIGEAMIRAGAMRLLAHREAFLDDESARATLVAWREAGAREAGLALLIDTPLAVLDPVIDVCDFVQLMSIARVGHQGEEFDDRALMRVEELHAKYPDIMVCVDGGVSEATVEALVRAGANRLCVGSAISQSPDPARSYAAILERALKGCVPTQTELAI